MNRVVLTGLGGANPLGFLAAVGLHRILHEQDATARLSFLSDGTFLPVLETVETDLSRVVSSDAARAAGRQPWTLEYRKEEKRGMKIVTDLKAPPQVFKAFLTGAVEQWIAGSAEGASYAAAFGTSIAIDGKGNTKPTAFHFTAANQQFLGTLELIRQMISPERVQKSLFEENSFESGANLRWDPAAERNWALMAANPTSDGTRVNAPLEWLAFRGLPLFPCYPQGSRILTTAVSGRGEDMALSWPLWSPPASIHTVRSLLQLPWSAAGPQARLRGVFAICRSPIKRTSQGFGNFGPASVLC